MALFSIHNAVMGKSYQDSYFRRPVAATNRWLYSLTHQIWTEAGLGIGDS